MKMGDGRLIVQVDQEDGEISAASVWHNAGLDIIYRRLFRNAWRQARRAERRHVDHGIRVVVFGSFWLEALVNRVLREIVEGETLNRSFGAAVWAGLKRVPLRDKLTLLQVYASDVVGCDEKLCLSEVGGLFEVRNRLAHFKDSDALVGRLAFVELDEVFELVMSADDPELIRELKAPAILLYAETVAGVARWVKKVERQFKKRHGITTPRGDRDEEPEE